MRGEMMVFGTCACAGPPFIEGEHLVENSAKLKVLDKLVAKAKVVANFLESTELREMLARL
jgi:hypothetical protein